MAATTYQILYRAFNEKLDIPLTNVGTYNSLIEMYNEDHKLYVTKEKLRSKLYEIPTDEEAERMNLEAETEKNELITYENSKDNIKFGMLFAYNGLKKINNKVFYPEAYGWVIDELKIGLLDQSRVAKTEDDYDKDFLYVDVNGILTHIMKPSKIESYRNKWKVDLVETFDKFKTYTTEEFKQKIADARESTPFLCKEEDEAFFHMEELQLGKITHATNTSSSEIPAYVPSASPLLSTRRMIFVSDTMTQEQIKAMMLSYGKNGSPFKLDTWSFAGKTTETYYIDPACIDALKAAGVKIYQTCETVMDNDNTSNGRDNSSFNVALIPEHYETSKDGSYIIKDTYIKIDGDPWFVYAIKHSLNDALDLSRKIIQRIGKENVKLIKLVPLDQKLGIK